MVQYSARVHGNRLIELPIEADSLGLLKGDVVEITVTVAKGVESANGILQDKTRHERAQAFRRWAESHPRDTPILSDEAISRETIYAERG